MGKANRRFTPPDHSVLPSLRGIRARPQRAQLPKLLGPPSAQQGQGADQLWQIIGLKLVVASLCTWLLMGHAAALVASTMHVRGEWNVQGQSLSIFIKHFVTQARGGRGMR